MDGWGWRRSTRLAAVLLAGASLAACATIQPKYATDTAPVPKPQGLYKVGKPYQVRGVWYEPAEDPGYDRKGVASWYGDAFHMKPTANGELFDMNAVSAAHTTLPLPSMVEVTNLDNGKKLLVRVNDRGPFVDNRIIDLSHQAARELGYDRAGLAHVRVRYVGPAPLDPTDNSRRMAKNDRSPVQPPSPSRAPRLPGEPLNPSELAGVPSTTAPFTPPTTSPPIQVAQLPPPLSPVTVAPLSPPPVGGMPNPVGLLTTGGQVVAQVAGLVPTTPPIIAPSVTPSITAPSVTPPAPTVAPPPTTLPPVAPSAPFTPTAPTDLAQAGGAAGSSSSAASAIREVAQPMASSAMGQPGVGLATPYRIQVGAFSDPLNARRAVSQLASAGEATIEPVTRDGTTLYRVLMDAPVDEGQAFTFRDTLAKFGFSDARVVRGAAAGL